MMIGCEDPPEDVSPTSGPAVSSGASVGPAATGPAAVASGVAGSALAALASVGPAPVGAAAVGAPGGGVGPCVGLGVGVWPGFKVGVGVGAGVFVGTGVGFGVGVGVGVGGGWVGAVNTGLTSSVALSDEGIANPQVVPPAGKHPCPQPPNVSPELGVSVSSMRELAAKTALHVVGQLIPGGELVTVPEPVPVKWTAIVVGCWSLNAKSLSVTVGWME